MCLCCIPVAGVFPAPQSEWLHRVMGKRCVVHAVPSAASTSVTAFFSTVPTASQALSGGQPPHPARVPMFPVSSPLGTLEPGPGYGPPGSALGFPELLRPDPVALYPGPGLPPGTPSLQDNGPLLLARSPDPGASARCCPEYRARLDLAPGD